MSASTVKPSGLASGQRVTRQVFRSVAPMHGKTRLINVHPNLSDGSAALMGATDVLYCDGSVQSVIIKQGQIPMWLTARARWC